jgi:hypothetical protein
VNKEWNLVLTLKSDLSAVIEENDYGKFYTYYGNWSLLGNEITVNYLNLNKSTVTQILKYHDKINLFDYRSLKRIRGLTPSIKNNVTGLLYDIKMVDKEILTNLINDGKIKFGVKLKTNYINFSLIFIISFFISLFIGHKNPFLFGLSTIILIASAKYFFHENQDLLLAHTSFGFIFSLLFSSFFKWFYSQCIASENDSKIRFIVGFSSGRGTRNVTIINPNSKNKKSFSGH